MLYYENRFAQDMQCVFEMADSTRRHAVNRNVSARVRSNQEAFEKFTELVNDGDFCDNLKAAKQNPNGKEARSVVNRVLRYINISGQKVPWGPQERAAEITKLMAIHRSEGAGSVFYSMGESMVRPALGRQNARVDCRVRPFVLKRSLMSSAILTLTPTPTLTLTLTATPNEHNPNHSPSSENNLNSNIAVLNSSV